MEPSVRSVSSIKAGPAPSAASAAAVVETDEELREAVANYDALHHTQGLPGSFAAQATIGEGRREGRGTPARSQPQEPPVEGGGGEAEAMPVPGEPVGLGLKVRCWCAVVGGA